jgi:glycosyltransferase involved in cell wall biosynthesis
MQAPNDAYQPDREEGCLAVTFAPTESAGRSATLAELYPQDSVQIVINEAITRRGVSGTARGVSHIARGLTESGFDVMRVSPRGARRRSRLLNAMRDAHWDLWQAGRLAGKNSILISPCNIGLASPITAHILWMHDTMVLDHPEWFDPGYARYARLLFGLSARHCSRLITPSHYTAKRVAAHWPDLASVRVLPWPCVPKAHQARVPPPRPWQILMVAATERHKNHAAAIAAISFARQSLGSDLHLTLVGPVGRNEEEVMRRVQSVDPERLWIRRLVGIAEPSLEQAYRSAWIVLQPAFDEGFCLPLLEAASYGTPVVHSGRGAMPEVLTCINANSVQPEVLSQRIVEIADPQRYAEASRSALADACRMTPERFRVELARLVSDVKVTRYTRRRPGFGRGDKDLGDRRRLR